MKLKNPEMKGLNPADNEGKLQHLRGKCVYIVEELKTCQQQGTILHHHQMTLQEETISDDFMD